MDLDDFLKRVRSSTQQRSFTHFTDRSNLASLKKHGIVSAREAKRRGLNVHFGGNQWSIDRDLATGMDAYVHLCFKRGHPMEKTAVDNGTIKDLVFLGVNPDVIKLPGVLVTDDVSNKVGVSSGPPSAMLDNVDLDVLYTRMKWQGEILERLKVAEKCEILVPTGVALNYVIEWPNG